MADISKIKFGSTEYNIKDVTARSLATQKASSTQDGIMSKEDKIKLDDALTTSNTSLEIYEDTANEIDLRINAGGTIFGETQLPIASTDSAGLMSTDDKAKLNGIATEANKYVLPAASETAIGGVKINNTLNSSPIVNVPSSSEQGQDRTYHIQKSSVNNDTLVVTVPWEDTKYGNATQISAGLMSANDKKKLDSALTTSGGTITGNLEVTGVLSVGENISANGNIHTYGSVSVERGSSDDILMADGSFQSLQSIKDTISAIPKFRTVVVNSLPADEETKSESVIYLVKSGSDTQNLYTEYIWINNAWEELGTQKVNLDGYLNTRNTSLSIYENTENEIELEINADGAAFASIQLPIASTRFAGLMSTDDKNKLDTMKMFTASISGEMLTLTPGVMVESIGS